MTNEATVSVAGYIATNPALSTSRNGTSMVKMRLAWTPRRLDRDTSQWVDQPTCFAWVKCWRKLAENVYFSMNKGDPIVVSGTLTISEYEKDGSPRTSVEISASAIGHDLSRGITGFRKKRPDDQASPNGEVRDGEAGDGESREGESVEFGVAETGAGDPAAGDLDDGDHGLRRLELVGADLDGSAVAADGSEREEAQDTA
jgi:single-strand DNA-binding protein